MYISKDGGTFPLFTEDWTSEEEVLLLDAIEQHGFGNWYVNYWLTCYLTSLAFLDFCISKAGSII